MTSERMVAFLLFAVVAAVTPGPSNVMLTAAGAGGGVLKGLLVLVDESLRRSIPSILVPSIDVSFRAVSPSTCRAFDKRS